MNDIICALSGVSKVFGKTKALNNVSLDVHAGELLALVGENGAGKTTAMGVLFGLLQPDAGHVEINGRRQQLQSAKVAIDAGLGMVHQHFQLYPGLSVLENVLVGQENTRAAGFLDFRSARLNVEKLITEFGFTLNPDQPVKDLPVDARQQLEIVKLLYRRASVIILDEPTAVLTPQESEALYAMLKSLCAQGRAVVLVTHRLDEVIAHTDRVLVMRHGALVAERRTALTSQSEIAELMVGRPIEAVNKQNAAKAGNLLCVQGISVGGPVGKHPLEDVSLDLACGEILGIAGVSGNGQRELVDALVGLQTLGLRLRAAGENPTALHTVGVSPTGMRTLALIACGVLCALGGAQLSISNVTLFTEGMSAGRGWIALVIMMMCSARLLWILPAAILFGFIDATGFRMQGLGMPQQATEVLPYILAIVVLTIVFRRRARST